MCVFHSLKMYGSIWKKMTKIGIGVYVPHCRHENVIHQKSFSDFSRLAKLHFCRANAYNSPQILESSQSNEIRLFELYKRQTNAGH